MHWDYCVQSHCSWWKPSDQHHLSVNWVARKWAILRCGHLAKTLVLCHHNGKVWDGCFPFYVLKFSEITFKTRKFFTYPLCNQHTLQIQLMSFSRYVHDFPVFYFACSFPFISYFPISDFIFIRFYISLIVISLLYLITYFPTLSILFYIESFLTLIFFFFLLPFKSLWKY